MDASKRPIDFIYGTNIAYVENERCILSMVIHRTDRESEYRRAIVMWNLEPGVVVRSILCDSNLLSFTFIGEGLLASRHSNPKTIKLMSVIEHEQLEIAESKALKMPISSTEWDFPVHGAKHGFSLTYLCKKSLWGRRFDGETQELARLDGYSDQSAALVAFSQFKEHIVLVFENGPFQIFKEGQREIAGGRCSFRTRGQRPGVLSRARWLTL
jgi:hypothetical protein